LWRQCLGGLLLLAGTSRALERRPEVLRRGWLSLLATSILWGLACIGLWELGELAVHRSTSLPLIPALLVLGGSVLLYGRGLDELSRVGVPAGLRASTLSTLILLLWTAMLLEGLRYTYDGSILPVYVRWLRPLPWQRALLLAPLWGGWAMLLALQFNRVTDRTEACIAQLKAGCGPATAAFTMALPLAGSLWYFNYLSWWQFTIPLVAILVAALAGRWLCQASGGLSRRPLLALNVLTQLAFLAAYLVNRR
jgi:hypothetical protein